MTQIKSLTPTQMQSARTRAENAVKRTLGERPSRDAYRREYGSLFNALDVIALFIFVAALFVSSTHIIKLMEAESMRTFTPGTSGIQISQFLYTIIHQIGLIGLAELSMILFLVMFRMTPAEDKTRYTFLIMSVLAAIFVFYANLASGLNLFIAALTPIFTTGIGFRLEQMIVEYLRRRGELDDKYTAAITTYENAQTDITTHPDYLQMLRSQVWSDLAKKNDYDPETPVSEKIRIVDAEIKRHDWSQEVTATHEPPPFGSNPRVSGVGGYISTMQSANGHTANGVKANYPLFRNAFGGLKQCNHRN